jgi:hypothetical protein
LPIFRDSYQFYEPLELSRFAVFRGFCWLGRGVLGSAGSFSLPAAVCATCSAPAPNFGSEFLALLRECLVDDLSAGVVCASGVLYDSLGVLS